tara:strand:+ start:416 stop:847 length:432 start_codon:yes stop_codon:yes gene_type:complete
MIKQFEDFANAHKQINEFKTGNLWEVVQKETLAELNYPMLFLQDSTANVGEGFITNGFNILVMDKANEGTIETEVKSDTLLILLDTIAYFEKLYTDNWKFVKIEKSGSISSFTERFDDTLTGWTMSMQLKQPLAYDECQIPQN